MRRNSNSSRAGSRGGHSTPASMKGHKLAQRLPHLSPNVDGSFISDVKGRSRIKTKGSLYRIFSTPGDTSFTIPEGIDTFTITAIGAGGAGGDGFDNRGTGTTGHGAGGGAKVVTTFTEVKPFTVIDLVVGSGGSTWAACSSTHSDAANGGSSTFKYLGIGYTAGGGCGGGPEACGNATGGTGGVATGGTDATLQFGNTGYEASYNFPFGLGGIGLTGPNGITYGWGGSGGSNTNGLSGGTGAHGVIIIS